MTVEDLWTKFKTEVDKKQPHAAFRMAEKLVEEIGASHTKPQELATYTLATWRTNHPGVTQNPNVTALNSIEPSLTVLSDYTVIGQNEAEGVTVLIRKN